VRFHCFNDPLALSNYERIDRAFNDATAAHCGPTVSTCFPCTDVHGVRRSPTQLVGDILSEQRVANVGGVAGIIIGWFWVPTGTFGTQLGKGSSIPMALAFLTGFSIDILFSALDRLKGTLTAAQEPAKATPR